MCLQNSIAWPPDSHQAAVTAVCETASEAEREAVGAAEYATQAVIPRDLFGPLSLRPVSIRPAWITPTVTSRTWAAYEHRSLPSGELDIVRLAVLADSLEEIGCQDAPLLEHLRGAGPHYRGCWAVDLILRKE